MVVLANDLQNHSNKDIQKHQSYHQVEYHEENHTAHHLLLHAVQQPVPRLHERVRNTIKNQRTLLVFQATLNFAMRRTRRHSPASRLVEFKF